MFAFLGLTLRKTGNVLHVTPAKKGVLALMEELGIRASDINGLTQGLNPKSQESGSGKGSEASES